MPERFAVPFDLMLAALGEREPEPRRRPFPSAEPRDVERPRGPVLQRHAAAPARHGVRGDIAGDVHLVHARHLIARVEEPMRQGAVVRQEQHAFDVGVETPDRIEPRLLGHELRHDGPPMRIAHGGDVALGLVEEHVAERFAPREDASVDGDDVDVGIGQRRQLADDRAVDGDAAFGDEALSSPS